MDIKKYVGRTITDVFMDNEILILWLSRTVNGKNETVEVNFVDDGQCCCESRYMSSDDDLHSLIGGQLMAVELKDGPDLSDDDYYCHDTQFLEISTSKGFVTIVNHNNHNGYYGGFSIVMTEK